MGMKIKDSDWSIMQKSVLQPTYSFITLLALCRSLQIAGILRGCARIQLRETERDGPTDHSDRARSTPLARVSNNVCPEWHLFWRREEPRENLDRPERLRQEHLSQTSCADRVHGSHRLLRAGKISHYRNSDSHPDSDHVRRQHCSKYEHVSARYAAGKQINICTYKNQF